MATDHVLLEMILDTEKVPCGTQKNLKLRFAECRRTKKAQLEGGKRWPDRTLTKQLQQKATSLSSENLLIPSPQKGLTASKLRETRRLLFLSKGLQKGKP